jgi:hypothetical protein
MTTTTSERSARDIALETLTPELRLRMVEWAELHNIPADDSIYWMAVMLKPDAQLQQQLDQGFVLIADAMDNFNSRLFELEESLQVKLEARLKLMEDFMTTQILDKLNAMEESARSTAEKSVSSRPNPTQPWLYGLALSILGTAVGISSFVWGYQQAVGIHPMPTSPSHMESKSFNLSPRLALPNQDKQNRCFEKDDWHCGVNPGSPDS